MLRCLRFRYRAFLAKSFLKNGRSLNREGNDGYIFGFQHFLELYYPENVLVVFTYACIHVDCMETVIGFGDSMIFKVGRFERGLERSSSHKGVREKMRCDDVIPSTVACVPPKTLAFEGPESAIRMNNPSHYLHSSGAVGTYREKKM